MLFKRLFNSNSKKEQKPNEEEIEAIWQKATLVKDMDGNIFRKDICGAWIRKDKFGDRTSEFGWEIDFLKPISKGGEEGNANKIPLHWENHLTKADQYPAFMCIITSTSSQDPKNVNKSVVVDLAKK